MTLKYEGKGMMPYKRSEKKANLTSLTQSDAFCHGKH